jgi:hypothetical protein
MRYRTMAAAAVLGLATLSGGCASDDHPKQIPLAANMVSEGRTSVAYTGVNDGVAYVYDTRDDRVVWSGPVQRGQTVRVDMDNDRVLVGDRLAAEKVLRSGHDHQIYFESRPLGDRRMTMERDTTMRSETTVQRDTSAAGQASDQQRITIQPDQKVTIESAPAAQQPRSTTIERGPAVDQQNTTTIERERTIQSR